MAKFIILLRLKARDRNLCKNILGIIEKLLSKYITYQLFVILMYFLVGLVVRGGWSLWLEDWKKFFNGERLLLQFKNWNQRKRTRKCRCMSVRNFHRWINYSQNVRAIKRVVKRNLELIILSIWLKPSQNKKDRKFF